jgi:DNA-binding transcriptional LysR family regulator
VWVGILNKPVSSEGANPIALITVLAALFLAHHLPNVQTQCPELEIEVLAKNAILSLTSHEADIALRPTVPSPFGRKLSPLRWAHYRSTDGDALISGAQADREFL